MSSEIDLEAYHGDSLVLPISAVDSLGAPVSLVGATFRFQCGTILETTSGVVIDAGDALGNTKVTVSYTAMSALALGAHDLAFEITFPNGIRETWFTGTLTILEDVRT